MEEKEYTAKLINNTIVVSDEALEYLKSKGIKSFKIKIIADFEEICQRENISKKLVEKIAATQRIPIEIALNVVRAKGKIQK